MTKGFSIDPDRLERFRSEADKARGEGRAAQGRVQDAHYELREAKDELQRLQRSLPGEPRMVTVRGDTGKAGVRRGESHHHLRIEGAQKRVEKAQAELDRLAAANNDGAAAREHTKQLFSRISAHTKGFVR